MDAISVAPTTTINTIVAACSCCRLLLLAHMCHYATQATMQSPVYWWNEKDQYWVLVRDHPRPNRFAFVEDRQWITEFAMRMGWFEETF